MNVLMAQVITLPDGTVRRLVQARTLGGLSSRQLALRAGLSSNFAAKIESGKSKAPAFGVISSFARVLGVSLDWLAHGIGPEPTAEQVQAAVRRAERTAARAA